MKDSNSPKCCCDTPYDCPIHEPVAADAQRLEEQAIRYCEDSGCLGDMDGQCEEGYGYECVEDWCQPCLTQGLLKALTQLRAERDTLMKRNSELCSSHNALLVDGARWQARAEQAEAERDNLINKLKNVELILERK